MMNGMLVEQNGQYYSVYTPNGIMVAQVFMGNDGQFTMYVDLVEKQFSKSSTSTKRYDLTNDVKDMFDIVRSES